MNSVFIYYEAITFMEPSRPGLSLRRRVTLRNWSCRGA